MAVTGIHAPQREQFLGQVERLAESTVLHSSESLGRLLRYLAKQAVDHPGEPVKEYQIAREVFSRPADFDPQLDSTIRVQVGRLRTKLSDYYASEGADDPVIIELPKGGYHLEFHHRVVPHKPAERADAQGAVSTEVPVTKPAKYWKTAAFVLAAALAISLAGMTWLAANHNSMRATTNQSESAPEAFRVFWQPFLSSPENPWVIFSNAAFVGRPEVGLRYIDPSRDSKARVFDHYTGVGEVLAVHDLDRVFEMFHRQLRVKRGSLFTLDDAQNNNLIFVGSPSENLTLTEIPATQDFVFRRLDSGPRKGDLAIINVHPRPREPGFVLASPSNSPLTEDYGVVALFPGSTADRWTMILAGTTTFGTQGTVQYVSSVNSVQQLLSELSASRGRGIPGFEALVHVKIEGGVPVSTDLVALRHRDR
jgi:hypothetical protein